MNEYLFVYGTLRRNLKQEVHPMLRDFSRYLDSATLNGKLYDIAGYPGAVAVAGRNNQRIHGEVYTLLDSCALFAILDHYEECSTRFPTPHEYRRCCKRVCLADGRILQAWVYLYQWPVKNLTPIASGDYQYR